MLEGAVWVRGSLQGRKIITASGTSGGHRGRDREVLKIFQDNGADLYCLGTTKDGFPLHPLYIKYATPLERYHGRSA